MGGGGGSPFQYTSAESIGVQPFSSIKFMYFFSSQYTLIWYLCLFKILWYKSGWFYKVHLPSPYFSLVACRAILGYILQMGTAQWLMPPFFVLPVRRHFWTNRMHKVELLITYSARINDYKNVKITGQW